ncbi:17043_t:CDS:2, partial [Racocetra fulgida]
PERKEYQRKLVARKRAEQKKPKTKEPVINSESRHGKYLDPNYGKKWMAQKRARDEGLTNAWSITDEFDPQSSDYLRARASITNLEKIRSQGQEFPLARPAHIYLEIAPAKNYYLRVYYQEKRGDELRRYQSYFTCKGNHPVNLRFYPFHAAKKKRKPTLALETQFLQ